MLKQVCSLWGGGRISCTNATADLLAEIKDIRDELNMIAKVLEDQRMVLPDLEASIIDIYLQERKRQDELRKRFKEMLKTIDTHVNDLKRMDKQAERIYKSITDLLDLKQKHANAFEARFARDQAAGTARQSQTIMVFTIVTIIFLPLTFIAAFFTINVQEFPHQPGGDEPSLPLAYVSKYTFGVGLSISVPFILIAFNVDAIGDTFRELRRRVRERRSKQRRVQNNNHNAAQHQNTVYGYSADTQPLEKVFSHGRSTVRPDGRRSIESYLGSARFADGGSLLPVTSRSTAPSRAAEKQNMLGTNGHTTVGGRLSVERPMERMSTGFRMRGSNDIERG